MLMDFCLKENNTGIIEKCYMLGNGFIDLELLASKLKICFYSKIDFVLNC